MWRSRDTIVGLHYSKAYRMLESHAILAQKNYPSRNRKFVSLHGNYIAYLHGTHKWVRQKEWKALPHEKRTNLANYYDTRDWVEGDYKYAIPVPHTPVVLRLYQTDIITFNPDGTLILDAGGYESQTTGKWINASLNEAHCGRVGNYKPSRWDDVVWGYWPELPALKNPFRQSISHWSVSESPATRFYSGMKVGPEGLISEAKSIPRRTVDKEKMRPFNEAVRRYRKIVLPWVQMLDGAPVPPSVAKEFDKDWVKYARDTDAQLNEIMTAETLNEYIVLGLMWRGSGRWHSASPQYDAQIRFESGLRQVRHAWIKKNGLSVVEG